MTETPTGSAGDWSSREIAMHTFLLVIELFIAAGLILVILLQRSEGGGLGMGGGSGSMGGLFTPRGAGDVLTRTTAILAGLFFLVCIGLNLVALRGGASRSILDSVPVTAAPVKAPSTTPAKPDGPSVPRPN